MTHQVEAKPEELRMAENITIKVPGKHQQTGEYGANEFKGQHIDIDELAMPLSHSRGAWIPRSPTSQVAAASRRSAAGRIRFAAGCDSCHARYQSDNRLCSLQRNSLHLERSFTSSIRKGPARSSAGPKGGAVLSPGSGTSLCSELQQAASVQTARVACAPASRPSK